MPAHTLNQRTSALAAAVRSTLPILTSAHRRPRANTMRALATCATNVARWPSTIAATSASGRASRTSSYLRGKHHNRFSTVSSPFSASALANAGPIPGSVCVGAASGSELVLVLVLVFAFALGYLAISLIPFAISNSCCARSICSHVSSAPRHCCSASVGAFAINPSAAARRAMPSASTSRIRANSASGRLSASTRDESSWSTRSP